MKSNGQYKQTEIGEIPEDWKLGKLIDHVSVNPTRILKKQHIAKYVPMANLNPFEKKIKGFEFKKFSGGTKFVNGDTLLARITPCLENGKTAYVDVLDNNEVGFGSTEYIILSGKETITDNQFVYYLATSPRLRQIAIQSMVGSSGRQRVQTDKLEQSIFAFPPVSEQRQIASILSLLDDKIELNRRMNKTLEEIGKALFKRWFVDFEFPNGNGEPYKSSGGEMVESELGEIPKGWKVGNLSDEFEILMGQSPPGSTYNENGNGLPFYQGRTDFGERFPSRRMFCSAPTRIAKKLDTLLSVRAPVGDINQANEECCIGRGVASIRKENHPTYTFYKLLYLKNIFLAYDKEGTVFGSINKTDLSKIQIILPPNLLVTMFEKELGIIDKQIFLNTTQIENLTNMRNSLLPRLMSGKIRVN